MKIDKEIINLSNEILIKSREYSNYYPIDRHFLVDFNFLDEIKEVNQKDFIFYLIENNPNLYSEQFLKCIPELWLNLKYSDIINLLEDFTKSFSYYAFLRFTYKYLEIDFLDMFFFNEKIKDDFKKNVVDYFKEIVATFYKDEDDFFDFEENIIGVSLDEWQYVKQKLLLDDKIKPVTMSQRELFSKMKLLNNFFNNE